MASMTGVGRKATNADFRPVNRRISEMVKNRHKTKSIDVVKLKRANLLLAQRSRVVF